MKAKHLLTAALLAAGLCSTQAHAGLIGSTATFEYRFPGPGDVFGGEGMETRTAVVGDGVEFTVDGRYSIDIQDDRIVYNIISTNWNPVVEHNGPRIVFAGIELDFAALNIAATSNGGNGLVFTWASSYVDLDWKNFSGTNVVVDVTAASNDVPEPASLALLAAGLAGAGAARRRKRPA